MNSINDKMYNNILLYPLSELINELTILKLITTKCKNFHKISDDDRTDLSDFQKDCESIETIIKKIFDELRNKGTYEELSLFVDAFRKIENEQLSIIDEAKQRQEENDYCSSRITNEKLEMESEIIEIMTKIGRIKDDIQNFSEESKIKTNYITQWEESRIEQHERVLKNKEQLIRNKLIGKKEDMKNEYRIHQEIINIYNEIDLDIARKIKQWKLKYENDMKIVERIEIVKAKKLEQQQKIDQLINKYIKRQKAIDDYKQYKITQAEKQKNKQRRNDAATTIQAWWHGVMVRKGFGKYRKKKDKKSRKIKSK